MEAATGEPRHLTNIEVEFSPGQDEHQNCSIDAKCKGEYADALDVILNQVEADFPVVDFSWGAKLPNKQADVA